MPPGPKAGMDALGEGVEHRTDYESAASAAKRRAFRPDIQGLRAVAVTLVVLYHCGVTFLGGGYVGVDVFFVISGFLITLHLVTEVDRTGKVSITGFYSRRIRRLLPPALVVVAATIVVARVWGPTLQSTRTAWDGLFATFYAMNYRLAGQGIDYQQSNAAPSPFQHFWSLAVEEQYYVVWPLVILVFALLTRRAGPMVRRGLLFWVLVAVIAASLHESITVTQTNGPLAYYSLQTRAWELGVGALVAVMLPALKWTPKFIAAAATWIGMGMILAAAVVFDDATAFPGALAAIPVAGSALVIAGGIVGSPWGVVRVLRGRVTQFIGHVSYGWYLWHWPVIILGPSVFGKELSTVENLELCVLALWFAVLTFLLVEQPTLRLRFDFKRWVGVAAMMSAIVAVTSLGAVALAPTVSGQSETAPTFVLSSDKPAAELSDLLSVSSRSPGVPKNLQPSLTAAEDDIPKTSFNGCHVGFLKVEQPPCAFGDVSANRTILMFGDSHMEQWFGALDQFGRAEGWKVVSWTKAACPVADIVIENEKLNRLYTECGEWRRQRLAAIAKMRPDVIVASQADTLAGKEFSNEQWAERTAQTVSDLTSSTKRLIFLTDTPHPPSDVPTCVAEHLTDVGDCSFVPETPGDSSSSQTYLSKRRASVVGAIENMPVQIVNPIPWFCTEKACPSVVADSLVYRDDSHMTQVYSRALEPLIANVIHSPRAGMEE